MKNMPNRSLLTLALVSSSLTAGCAWLPWNSDGSTPSSREMHGRIVPHARIQDGADSAAAFHALGRHLQREGRLEDAERAFRRALDFDPAYTEARNALAVLAASRGDLAQAIAMLSSLVASSPDQPHLLTNLGYAYYLNGDYALAKERLIQALSIAPDNDSARQKLTLVKEKLGEPAEVQGAVSLAAPTLPSPKEAVGPPERPAIVRLSDSVYQLIRPLGKAEATPQLARCDLPHAAALQVQTPASLSVTPQSQPAVASANTERLRLELVNGNGINRLARSVRDLISGPQWQVVRVLNHEEFSVAVTRIEYAKHHYSAAQTLASRLGVDAQLRPNYHQGDTQLRIVLGKDFRTTDNMREHAASNMPLLAGAE